MTTWMVTGGAGYIGSHVAAALVSSGRTVVVLDDLSTGDADRLPSEAIFIKADVADASAVGEALHTHSVTGIVHLAAKKAVGESVTQPWVYYRENLVGLMTLLEQIRISPVENFVYSSSAAVYGTPATELVSESSPTEPESPYGETKLWGERILQANALAIATEGSPFSWVALRYFNVAGAGSENLGDSSVNNLIPMVFRALSEFEQPQIFGTDYLTPDGTCIRDYIDVRDLAAAHVAAIDFCEKQPTGTTAEIFNVGRGEGCSVRQVIDTISTVTRLDFVANESARRPGDPAALVADPARIQQLLGWQANYDLSDMVESAWAAFRADKSATST